MNEPTARHLPPSLWTPAVTRDPSLEAEFEARLVESSTLAFRIAYGVLRQREDAEEVAQEAFAKAYRRFAQLRDRDRFRAWLVRMTWRLALDRQRADRRRIAREHRAGHEGANANADGHHGRLDSAAAGDLQTGVEAAERAAHLWRAIDALSEKLRVVVVLAGIQGVDVKEIAALLELPEGTVKSRLFEARRQLKDALAWMANDLRR